jgi:hypothetical protein
MTTVTANYANTALAADLASSLPMNARAPVQQPRKMLPQKTAVQTVEYQPGFLSRLLGTFIAARQRAADRDVARYLATTGGKMTDNIEREIQRLIM